MTFEELVAHCQADGRVAPAPRAWTRMWALLNDEHWQDDTGCPSPPLILAGWWATDDEAKRRRFLKQLAWARDHGAWEDVEHLLVGFGDQDWHGTPGGRIGRW